MDTLKRVFQYDPTMKIPILASQRQIKSSVAPYMIGQEKTWENVLFLMKSDSAIFTQNLYIPRDEDLTHIEELLQFLTKRGMFTFDNLEMSITIMDAIRERLGAFHTRSMRYVIQGGINPVKIWFPEFTTDIRMTGGTIINIPERLVNLTINLAPLDNDAMEAIGNAPHIRFLSLSMTHDESGAQSIRFRGLPQHLEELEVEARLDIVFTEGYPYDCKRLTRLKHTIWTRDEVSNPPPGLISSMQESLTHLEMTRHYNGDPVVLGSIVSGLSKLRKLYINGYPYGSFVIPPSVTFISVSDNYPASNSLSLNPLPELACLEMRSGGLRVEVVKNTIRSSPNLEKLMLNCHRLEFHPLGIQPQIRSVRFPWPWISSKDIRSVLKTFPNVTTIEHRSKWSIDLTNKTFEMRTCFYDLLEEYNHRDLSFVGARIETFHFTLHEIWMPKPDNTLCNIQLPSRTKEVTITIEEHRKNEMATFTCNLEEVWRRSNIRVRDTITLSLSYYRRIRYAEILLPEGYTETIYQRLAY